MKKFFVLALVLALLLAGTTTAAAKGKTGVNLYGQITAIDAGELTISVKVESPLKYKGDTIIVQVTDATILKECVDGISHRVPFSAFDIGEDVRASGTLTGDVLLAAKVIGYP